MLLDYNKGTLNKLYQKIMFSLTPLTFKLGLYLKLTYLIFWDRFMSILKPEIDLIFTLKLEINLNYIWTKPNLTLN